MPKESRLTAVLNQLNLEALPKSELNRYMRQAKIDHLGQFCLVNRFLSRAISWLVVPAARLRGFAFCLAISLLAGAAFSVAFVALEIWSITQGRQSALIDWGCFASILAFAASLFLARGDSKGMFTKWSMLSYRDYMNLELEGDVPRVPYQLQRLRSDFVRLCPDTGEVKIRYLEKTRDPVMYLGVDGELAPIALWVEDEGGQYDLKISYKK